MAADHFSWHGSGWGTKAGFLLAREALGSRVEDIDIDVMDLTPERVGTFDVVLFLGVLYHLRHPFLALERVSSVTRDRLILETVVDLVGFAPSRDGVLSRTGVEQRSTNWWGPNIPAVHGMLESLGFEHVTTVTRSRTPPIAPRALSIIGFVGRTRCSHFVRTARCSTR